MQDTHAKYASNTTKKPTTNSSSNGVKIGICKQRGNQRPVLAAHLVYLSPKSDAIFSCSEDTTTISSHKSHGNRKANSHLELNMTRPNSCSVAERYMDAVTLGTDRLSPVPSSVILVRVLSLLLSSLVLRCVRSRRSKLMH